RRAHGARLQPGRARQRLLPAGLRGDPMTRLLPLAGAALGGGLLVALVLALTGGSGHAAPKPATTPKPVTYTAARGDFSVATPDGWKAVADGSAATVLRRAD